MALPKVSVIIPVYNVEAYVEKCVTTLFNQTLKDIEYIFVNDSTQDQSIEIIEACLAQYPQRRDQVKIVTHPQNLGISAARNTGITYATGEYIIHCDPDDWVDDNYYLELYNRAKETCTDIVICDYYHHPVGSTMKYVNQRPDRLDSDTIMSDICGLGKTLIHGSLWNKLVKGSCYKNISLPNGITYCEDSFILFQLLECANKIDYLNKAYYHYISRNDSLTGRKKNGYDDAEIISKFKDMMMHLKTIKKTEYWKAYSLSILINRSFISGTIPNYKFKILAEPLAEAIGSYTRYNKLQKLILKYSVKFNYKVGRYLWMTYNILNKYIKIA